MLKRTTTLILLVISLSHLSFGQNVPIISYDVNNYGQVELEIEGEADKYYTLTALQQPNADFEIITSMTMGQDGNMIISEPLEAFPLQNYKVTAHSINSPDDSDFDGKDDISEFNDMPTQAPLNYARQVPYVDGAPSIPDYDVFSDLSVVTTVSWAPFLDNQEFVKFAIVNQDSDEPEVYFINSNTHSQHSFFLNTINVNQWADDVVTGEIVYIPSEILPNGAIGLYLFNYSFGDAFSFSHTQRTFEVLARNMPYLQNNLQHFIGMSDEQDYINNHRDDYNGSRIDVVLESELFSEIDYIPFNKTEGFGLFRHMALDENPGSRDIVLYDALPNSLPRVGGIITSVIQTPLSHVNLRAIQDNVPNAYIKNPLQIDSIADLLGKYVYYKVEDEEYEIREASLDEVNDWYERLRPTEEQIPERDLSQTAILPLNDIDFTMSTAFGAKCSNVATMRTFGFPEGTIPDGFGIPFYYYDEFMKFNSFYDKVEDMLADPDFINDLETRIDMLKDFRRDIKDANMPQWMLNDLQDMHDAFPDGTAVRCRSSTNNEDLPGFSGAGLYTSKTQHLDEGHISKSIKQVYASMWNFRAYDEREFYRVDHYIAAMGVLCHPNFEEEESNGVGVSLDPFTNTDNNYYLNTQVGEALITNPDPNDVPEEILLSKDPAEGYFIIRSSNLVPNGELVMSEEYLDSLRQYLITIHDKFEILYNVVGAEGFGMDIEYKVTAEEQLIIKQARPWVSFWADIKADHDLGIVEIVEPQSSASLSNNELITAKVSNQGLRNMSNFDLLLFVENQLVETLTISDELTPQSAGEYQFTIPQDFSTIGQHNVAVVVSHPSDGFGGNDSLAVAIDKLYLLEGEIRAELKEVKCGEEIDLKAIVTNHGETTFANTEIEVVVNGMVVDLINYDFSIPYQAEVEIAITVTDNLTLTDNDITLNLVRVNGQEDDILANNSSSFNTDLDTDHEKITLLINADDYPQETSWELFNENTGELITTGSLNSNTVLYTEDICVDYNSCFTLIMYDSAFDGLCCFYGFGNFSILNADGETIVYNDGEFGGQVEELFCPGGGCLLSADISVIHASVSSASDGSIVIEAENGEAPYEYSIDGGITFQSSNEFFNLPPGQYFVVVRDATLTCSYSELVEIDFGSNVNDVSIDDIKVYPNPTNGNVIIEMDPTLTVNGDVKIAVYSSLGQLIKIENVTRTSGTSRTIISLEANAPGTYFAKCYNENFEKYFKVIKM